MRQKGKAEGTKREGTAGNRENRRQAKDSREAGRIDGRGTEGHEKETPQLAKTDSTK